MSTKHVLADTDIDRLIGVRDTLAEALTPVRRLLQANGNGDSADVAVGVQDDDGEIVGTLTGDDLLARVKVGARRNRVAVAWATAARRLVVFLSPMTYPLSPQEARRW